MNTTSATSKLSSLLALSAGAVALPQVGHASIIYSGAINEKVGFSAGYNVSYTLDLPGTASLQLIRGTTNPVPYVTGGRVDFQQNSGYARVRAYSTAGAPFARRNDPGQTWDTILGTANPVGRIGWWTSSVLPFPPFTGGSTVRGPGSFSDKYIAFMFQDDTAGNALRYGWARMDLSVSAHPRSGPDVLLKEWAYDDSGEKIAMGAGGSPIPESTSAALVAAIGALALGGIRQWRASKQAAKSAA